MHTKRIRPRVRKQDGADAHCACQPHGASKYIAAYAMITGARGRFDHDCLALAYQSTRQEVSAYLRIQSLVHGELDDATRKALGAQHFHVTARLIEVRCLKREGIQVHQSTTPAVCVLFKHQCADPGIAGPCPDVG
jgi:hypothetical protein